MARVLRLASMAAGLWLVAASACAAAVAFVTDLKGDVRIAGGAKVAFLGELDASTRLVLEMGARLTVIYTASGVEYTITGPGEYLVDATEVKSLKGPAPARRTVVARPDPVVVARLAESAMASVRMRSAVAPAAPTTRPALLYPRSAQVATLQPTLLWNADTPPDGFTVVVATTDGKPVWRGRAKASPAKVPVRLAPATRYTWTLFSGETSIGEASFETLPTDAIKRADASRAAMKSFSDRILHAFLLQDVGAVHDARQAWAELARERPDLPELAILAK